MTASAQQQAIAVADFYVDLGRRIAEARAKAGMGQVELGARMGGLTRSGISNVETGRSAIAPLWLLTGDPAAVEPAGTLTGPLRAEQ